MAGSVAAWRTALGELPVIRGGRWAVGGSASLALHGLPVDPRDLDLLVDHVAAAELVIIVGGRRIPVLPLRTMQVLLDATGNPERAAMVAKVVGPASDR
jgi:hypothetical protein